MATVSSRKLWNWNRREDENGFFSATKRAALVYLARESPAQHIQLLPGVFTFSLIESPFLSPPYVSINISHNIRITAE